MIIKKEYQNYDYWCWKNYFNKNQIKEFNKLINKNIISKEDPNHAAVNGKNESLKNLKTYIVKLSAINKFIKPLINSVYYVNDKNFQYDLYHNNFELYDTGNYNIYSSKNNSEYKWHIDSSGDVRYDLKFTVLINLSEKKYDGGDFKVFNTDTYNVDEFKNPGSVLMFKSHLNHCVTPILSGERKTFTIFVYGPKWK